MALIGLSLLFGAVVWVLVRPPVWLSPHLLQWRGLRAFIDRPPSRPAITEGDEPRIQIQDGDEDDEATPERQLRREREGGVSGPTAKEEKQAADRKAMPPPPPLRKTAKEEQDRRVMPPPPPIIQRDENNGKGKENEDQMTPKAGVHEPSTPVPSFSLDDTTPVMTPPSFPAANSPQRASGSLSMPPPSFPALNSQQRAGGGAAATGTRLPSVFGRNTAQQRTLPVPTRTLPIPNRGPPAGGLAPPATASSSSLAPPPTHSTKPAKPSRKVLLAPGHSPLDWAAISGPAADLRGLPLSTPYLRVTPSMLKEKTGRKGKDAWTVLGGKVYNITPYLPFHPGGEPELLKCAGRDGNRLFGEVHPWVNYENMLQACLVGIYVDENERVGHMEEMD